MCTVSWVRQPDGYHLLCNRDEKRTRGAGLAPRVLERGGVRYLAPVDSDFGGTWIAVNERGMSLCLLNGAAGRSGSRSRGLLLHELIWAPSAGESMLWLRQLDLRQYVPFTLAAIDPLRPAMVAEWDGASLAIDPCGGRHMPLTSSSYDPAGVRRERLNDFARHVGPDGVVDPEMLYRFHCSHGAAPGPYSTCMHREDAGTVSFSWAIVNRSEVRFLYSPGAPCAWSASRQQILARAA